MRDATRYILSLGLVVAAVLAGGCHTMEGISYDIEDGTAYMGEQLAEQGENLAEWMRGFNEDND